MTNPIRRRARALTAALGLLALTAGCGPSQSEETASPADSPVWRAASDSGAFTVEAGPRDADVPIGQFHHWTVLLLDEAGRPVYPARIGINGGMPGHGHGMPSQPQVTEHLGDGRYLIEGMKFNMAGAWVLVFGIEAAGQRDSVQVEIELQI